MIPEFMRKGVAITMLIVFLLNVLGYYGVFVGLRLRNVQELVQKLDDNRYEASETSTFKIPVTIPYYTDSDEFERVDGEFEHNGDIYRLVKQRLYQDTLHIVCIKDQESKNINQVLTDYVKTFTDKTENAKQGSKTVQFSLIKDYISFSITIGNDSFGWESTMDYSRSANNLIPTFATSVIHPPERA
jgi:hypothetical protein